MRFIIIKCDRSFYFFMSTSVFFNISLFSSSMLCTFLLDLCLGILFYFCYCNKGSTFPCILIIVCIYESYANVILCNTIIIRRSFFMDPFRFSKYVIRYSIIKDNFTFFSLFLMSHIPFSSIIAFSSTFNTMLSNTGDCRHLSFTPSSN